jgi:hypothetical protein
MTVAVGSGEHEALPARPRPPAKVRLERLDDDRRHGHRPLARLGLQWLQRPPPVRAPPQLLDDAQLAVQQVDAVSAQPGKLPQPQAAEGSDDDEGPVAGVDPIGEQRHVARFEEAHLLRLDPGWFDPSGLRASTSFSTAAASTRRKARCTWCTVAGLRWPAASSASQARTIDLSSFAN